MVAWFEWVESPKRESSNGITIPYQPTALPGGSVPDVLVQAIQSTRISELQKLDMQTSLCFTVPAVTIASFAKTGIIETSQLSLAMG